MSFHARRRLPASATFYQDVSIKMDGHVNAGGAEILAEVEYRAFPDRDDVEIVSVRPYTPTFENLRMTTIREYPACPPWLESYLTSCVDDAELVPDWSDI